MFKILFPIYVFTYGLLISIQQCNAVVIPLDPQCQNALGLENKGISDSNMETKADAVQSGKKGSNARLNNQDAWCTPSSSGSSDVFTNSIYLQINLLGETQITALALQGWNQYSYGRFIRLRYDFAGTFVYYQTKDGVKDIPVKNFNKDQYEYIVLEPPLTTNSLRIYLQYGSNSKCLRAELYGCQFGGRDLEYKDCPSTNQEILTDNLLAANNVKYITESDKVVTHNFDGEKILFSQPHAWCVKKDEVPTDIYKEWVQIDMRNSYLLYGLKVDDYREQSGQYLTKNLKLYYSLDASKWAAYEGGRVISTADYQSNMLTFNIPLAAKFVRVFIRINGTDNTCLKMQLYGCRALTFDDVETTTTPSKNGTANTTPAVKAKIVEYKIYQGNDYSKAISWKDMKYTGKMNHEGKLSNGEGCLTDHQYAANSNPLEDPTCWIGWKKTNVSKPFLEVETSQAAYFTGLFIRTYVNEDIGASTIKRLTIEYSTIIGVGGVLLGYVCAPPEFYHISPQIKDFYIRLDIKAQYLTVNFEYSGDWMLVRQVMLQQGPITGKHYMKPSVISLVCEVPLPIESTKESKHSTNIVIIVCAVLGLCLFLVLAFLLYHYRTSLHHVFKARPGEPIILRTSYEKKMERSAVHVTRDNNGYDRMTRQGSQPSYSNRYNSERSNDEEIYAAPDICSINSDRSLLLNSPQYPQYPLYDDVSDAGRPPKYAQPKDTLQYSEPNSPNGPNPIYQGSAIYAESFKSPYQAVVASSIYSDPQKLFETTAVLRQFPREQLSFKEKIGVGQFGEVHIAEATGLDEIYGNMGHYNSWGCTDTALVAVKVLKSDDDEIAHEFLKEIEVMAQLKHENVVRLLGVCKDKPMIMVCEYMENGDLNQFLQNRKPCDEQNVRASMIPHDVLLSDSLIHMAQQIAAGMKYLHSEGFIHRDLATRNCLVGPAYQVKVADFGMSRYLYSKQYYRVEGKAILPIRWMAPECMFYGKFTNLTDVWSFGVTLWEIFSFARKSPYEELSDPEVIELSCDAIQHPDGEFSCLKQPQYCPPEIYELMRKCWQLESENRPSFAYMNRFFTDLCNSVEGLI